MRCSTCGLVFVPSLFFLSPENEKKRYDMHVNNPADDGYRMFLLKLVDPVIHSVPADSHGLDFGSGPEPLLARLLQNQGMQMTCYDPYYRADESIFTRSYDFITACEVVEHLYHPGRELARVYNLLKPGGLLAIMTSLVPGDGSFSSWHYISDPTHVMFFSEESFKWLAGDLGSTLSFPANNVIFLKKQNDD
jgi:SAM-dependent methyltransferase